MSNTAIAQNNWTQVTYHREEGPAKLVTEGELLEAKTKEFQGDLHTSGQLFSRLSVKEALVSNLGYIAGVFSAPCLGGFMPAKLASTVMSTLACGRELYQGGKVAFQNLREGKSVKEALKNIEPAVPYGCKTASEVTTQLFVHAVCSDWYGSKIALVPALFTLVAATFKPFDFRVGISQGEGLITPRPLQGILGLAAYSFCTSEGVPALASLTVAAGSTAAWYFDAFGSTPWVQSFNETYTPKPLKEHEYNKLSWRETAEHVASGSVSFLQVLGLAPVGHEDDKDIQFVKDGKAVEGKKKDQ